MCAIIDANCASKIAKKSECASAIVRWLASPTGHLALGGKTLILEYQKIPSIMTLISELSRVGKVKRYSSDVIDSAEKTVLISGRLKSNDSHIIALALVSGARILFSNDQDLHTDFSNIEILKPKGRVYQNNSHNHILGNSPKCS